MIGTPITTIMINEIALKSRIEL